MIEGKIPTHVRQFMFLHECEMAQVATFNAPTKSAMHFEATDVMSLYKNPLSQLVRLEKAGILFDIGYGRWKFNNDALEKFAIKHKLTLPADE